MRPAPAPFNRLPAPFAAHPCGLLTGVPSVGVRSPPRRKLGLRLASINPSASPIWPATGLALAAVLLGGLRLWPAILVGAFAANVTTAGTLETSMALALGNTLEALAGGYLIRRWSGGINTFDSPSGVAKFAAISFAPATVISASPNQVMA